MEKNLIKTSYLSYLGDSIYELFVREYLLNKYKDVKKINDIQSIETKIVCAKYQSAIIDNFFNDNILTEDEIYLFKMARNAHTKSKSKNASSIEYHKATGFEAVLGYLYISKNIDRLNYIMDKSIKYIDFSTFGGTADACGSGPHEKS